MSFGELEKLQQNNPYPSVLRVLGGIDFSDYLNPDFSPPEKIRIDKNSTIVFHDSLNGSGAMFEPAITKIAELPYNLRIDNNWSYGVNAVYSFCNSAFSNNLF